MQKELIKKMKINIINNTVIVCSKGNGNKYQTYRKMDLISSDKIKNEIKNKNLKNGLYEVNADIIFENETWTNPVNGNKFLDYKIIDFKIEIIGF